MAQKKTKDSSAISALIYCRVSSVKQRIDGAGLQSQEQRCRTYAEDRGYTVDAVFPDDSSGGGDFMKRPGMVALLAYLDAQPDIPHVVIFDDLKRFARDTEFHIKLRRELATRGARVECLNFKFEDTPEGKFVETVFAAQGELEREQNRRQVIQKMRARIENGYWVFRAPVGYRYEGAKGGGKVLVPDEPLASVVREALQGFADGRFGSQSEVVRFLENDPHFPKDRDDGSIRPMTVSRLLKKVVYAGCVEAPSWGVGVRDGQHEGLISFDTHERIQELLEGKKRRFVRKTAREEFPMRGHVHCSDCGKALTAAWSKGKTKHYAYYRCETRGCAAKGKSIPVRQLHDDCEDILKAMTPARPLFALVKAMFRDAWDMRLTQAEARREDWKRQIRDVEKQVEELLDRIVEARSPTVIAAYEARIDKLERQKRALASREVEAVPETGRLEECIELALGFLSNPWKIYEKGSFAVRQTVLKLAFSKPLQYGRNGVYGTPEMSFPFKVLENFCIQNGEMVPLEGLEPPLLSERDFESRASTGSATGAPVASAGSIAERRRHARRPHCRGTPRDGTFRLSVVPAGSTGALVPRLAATPTGPRRRPSRNGKGRHAMKILMTTTAATLALGATALGATAFAPAAQALDRQPGYCGESWVTVDTDNNGRVTRSEALAALDVEFSAIDANSDDAISREEYRECVTSNRYRDEDQIKGDGSAGQSASGSDSQSTSQSTSGSASADKSDRSASAADEASSIPMQSKGKKDAIQAAYDDAFGHADRNQDERISLEEYARTSGDVYSDAHRDAATAPEPVTLRRYLILVPQPVQMSADGSQVRIREMARDEAAARAAHRFGALDRDGDGMLTRSEFNAEVTAGLSPSLAEKHFEAMDADGDGEMTREEYRQARGADIERAREAVQAWDRPQTLEEGDAMEQEAVEAWDGSQTLEPGQAQGEAEADSASAGSDAEMDADESTAASVPVFIYRFHTM